MTSESQLGNLRKTEEEEASGSIHQSRPRRFSREAKLRILREIGIAKSNGLSVGALLRREGLYSSQVAVWRKQLDSGALEPSVRGPGRPRKSEEAREVEKSKAEVLLLREENRQLRAIIEAQKKIAQILGTPVESRSET